MIGDIDLKLLRDAPAALTTAVPEVSKKKGIRCRPLRSIFGNEILIFLFRYKREKKRRLIFSNKKVDNRYESRALPLLIALPVVKALLSDGHTLKSILIGHLASDGGLQNSLIDGLFLREEAHNK